MRTWFGSTAVVLGLVGGLAAGACSSSPAVQAVSGDSGVTPGADSGVSASGGDGGTDGESSADAPSAPAQTFLRIAHLSPDAPALDVCVAPHGTTVFQGPLLAQFAASLLAVNGGGGGDAGDAGDAAEAPEDAGAVGLSYSQISAYIPLSPGQYDARLVAAGASSCDRAVADEKPLDDSDGGDAAGADGGGAVMDAGVDAAVASDGSASDAGNPDATFDGAADASIVADAAVDGGGPEWTNLPTLGAGANATLLLAGDLVPAGHDAPLTLSIVPDDVVLAGGAAELRAINALPSYPAVDLGLGSTGDAAAAAWLAILTNVGFASASTQAGPGNGAVNANGYLPIGPLAAQPISARASGSDAGVDVARASSVEIDQGTIATIIAIGGKSGDAANPPALLLCNDNQPAGGLLSDCRVAP